MTAIKYTYALINRETGKTVNIHNKRSDARSEKKDWKSEGHDVVIVQSKYCLYSQGEIR